MLTINKNLPLLALTFALLTPAVLAQISAVTGPPLQVVPPENEFATSDAHYQYLLEQTNDGTQHT